MAELIDPAVRLNMRIFKALDGMMKSRLAATIPFRELRQFAVAFLAADSTVMVTHCPWCSAPVSVADEPYCANDDCRWNNGGTAPDGVDAGQAEQEKEGRD